MHVLVSNDGAEWRTIAQQRSSIVEDAASNGENVVVVGLDVDHEEAGAWLISGADEASPVTSAEWKRKKVRPFLDEVADLDIEPLSHEGVEIWAVAWRDPEWIAMGVWGDGSGTGGEIRAYTSTDGHHWRYQSHQYYGGEIGFLPSRLAANAGRAVSVGHELDRDVAASLTSS